MNKRCIHSTFHLFKAIAVGNGEHDVEMNFNSAALFLRYHGLISETQDIY